MAEEDGQGVYGLGLQLYQTTVGARTEKKRSPRFLGVAEGHDCPTPDLLVCFRPMQARCGALQEVNRRISWRSFPGGDLTFRDGQPQITDAQVRSRLDFNSAANSSDARI